MRLFLSNDDRCPPAKIFSRSTIGQEIDSVLENGLESNVWPGVVSKVTYGTLSKRYSGEEVGLQGERGATEKTHSTYTMAPTSRVTLADK